MALACVTQYVSPRLVYGLMLVCRFTFIAAAIGVAVDAVSTEATISKFATVLPLVCEEEEDEQQRPHETQMYV